MTMARPTSRADGGGGNALKGTWDEVTIHDVKLTAGEVDSLFHAGPGTNVVNTLPSSSEILVDAFSTEFESRGGAGSMPWSARMTWWRTTGRTPRTNTYLGGNGGTMAFTVSMGASEIKAYRVVIK